MAQIYGMHSMTRCKIKTSYRMHDADKPAKPASQYKAVTKQHLVDIHTSHPSMAVVERSMLPASPPPLTRKLDCAAAAAVRATHHASAILLHCKLPKTPWTQRDCASHAYVTLSAANPTRRPVDITHGCITTCAVLPRLHTASAAAATASVAVTQGKCLS